MAGRETKYKLTFWSMAALLLTLIYLLIKTQIQ